jgi:glycosyltransferase involved in cell wall biosynthesis/SAM-dependent methyltransferase
MRVGVVTTQAPFIIGGAERHSANLVAALRARGHEATEISIPYKWYPGRALVDHVMAAKLIDLADLGYPVDLMVGLKFPAYLAHHPNKAFWILHQHRQAYDIWEAGQSELQRDPDGAAVRELIRAEDRAAIGAPGARVYANSLNVAGRLRRYLGLGAEPLYHPPPNAGRLREGPFGDYLYAPSRLGPTKRQTLMIEALAHAPGARLVIAGPPDAPGYDDELRRLARARGVEDRVEVLGPVDDATMIRLYAECRAVVFVPVDEDYGYITLEAMLSGKPVVTVTDAGGPLEFIEDGAQGLVAAPEPEALGAAFARVTESPAEAEAWGRAARAKYAAKRIAWDTVVETLTGEPLPHAAAEGPADAPAAIEPGAAPPVSGSGAHRASKGEAASGSSPAGMAPAPGAGAPPDLARLAARIAPPVPARLPFADLDALIAAYDFDTWPGEWARQEALHRPYFASHWRRYAATLALLEDVPGARMLDAGIVPPFLFQGMLATARPEAGITGVWSEPRPFVQTVRARAAPGRDFTVRLHPGDVERDPLPGADGSADIVLAMEILEHLACDPTWFLAEANRVLAPGGHLLVTTPNIASHRNALKALAGEAPYSFGLFVPVGGVHGRHNREFVAPEVRAMGEAAGFETVRLLTADVYDDRIDPEMARLLAARGDDFSFRGETIFWLGRKAGPPGETPPRLFHGRPEQLSGRLLAEGRDAATGRVTVRAENASRARWAAGGAFAIALRLDWEDARGRLVHQGAEVPLPHPVAPGEAVRIALPLDADAATRAEGWLTVRLFETGAGPMDGAGRADRLRLACSEAAFLALAGAR